MASSLSHLTVSSLILPVLLVVSDQEPPDDGKSVVLSCVPRKYFGFFEVSQVRLSALTVSCRYFVVSRGFQLTPTYRKLSGVYQGVVSCDCAWYWSDVYASQGSYSPFFLLLLFLKLLSVSFSSQFLSLLLEWSNKTHHGFKFVASWGFFLCSSCIALDQELPATGTAVLSCILCKYFDFFEVSQVCLLASRQHPVGVLLPLAAPSLCWLINSFLLFTKEQYLAIALVLTCYSSIVYTP
jgi:hypothetical protein